MAYIAVEAIKIKLDSTGEEVVYEPNTDTTTMAEGVLVETAKIFDTDTNTEITIEAGKPTSDMPPVAVLTSTVEDAAPSNIVVTFAATPQFNFNDVLYKIEGVEKTPVSVSLDEFVLTIETIDPVITTDTVAWSKNAGDSYFDVVNNVV